MVTKIIDQVVDSITEAITPRSRPSYKNPEEIVDEIRAVQRASRTHREAYIRRMKMRTRPHLSTREVELAIARAIRQRESE